jgi:hypothetical protein
MDDGFQVLNYHILVASASSFLPPCLVILVFYSAMTAGVTQELVNSVTCPKCGYNNMSGKMTCEGPLEGGGICGAELYAIV